MTDRLMKFDELVSSLNAKSDRLARERQDRFQKFLVDGVRDAIEKTLATGQEQQVEGVSVFGRPLWIKPFPTNQSEKG